MLGTDRLLMLTLLFAATTSMLYKRYKPRFPTLASSMSSSQSSSSSSPSSSLLEMRKQLDAANRSRARLGLRSKWSRNTCQVQALSLHLEPPLRLADVCSAAYVQSFGCRGGCSSYSQVDPRNATSITHSCSCCKPLRFMVSIAVIPCKNGLHIRVPMKSALGCSCRPCFLEEAPKDILTLRDLLSKPALDTPLPIG